MQLSPRSWGLDRIDQASLPLDASYEYDYDGSGVQVFILDSGIQENHSQFSNRATCGLNLVETETCDDTNGHGTHVAGIVGGTTVGVAKGVSLVSIKVFDVEGGAYISSIFAGLEYIMEEKMNNPDTPMVVNLSLGSPEVIPEYTEIIDDVVALGIVVVIAAGNESIDACDYSPAFVPSAITVGASDRNDQSAVFTNYGKCVDIFAPGVDINSAFFIDNESLVKSSGTSMAAPFVTGAAALYLQANPEWTSAQVLKAMRDDATDVVHLRRQREWDPRRILARFFRNRQTTGLLLQTNNI